MTGAAATGPVSSEARQRPPLRIAAYAAAWIALIALIVVVSLPEQHAAAHGRSLDAGTAVTSVFEKHGYRFAPAQAAGRGQPFSAAPRFEMWLEGGVAVAIDVLEDQRAAEARVPTSSGGAVEPLPGPGPRAMELAGPAGSPVPASGGQCLGSCPKVTATCGAVVTVEVPYQSIGGPSDLDVADEVRRTLLRTIDGACHGGTVSPEALASAMWHTDLDYAIGLSGRRAFAPNLIRAAPAGTGRGHGFLTRVRVFRDPVAALTAYEQAARTDDEFGVTQPSWNHDQDQGSYLLDAGYPVQACNVLAVIDFTTYHGSMMFAGESAPFVASPHPAVAVAPSPTEAAYEHERAIADARAELRRTMDELRGTCDG